MGAGLDAAQVRAFERYRELLVEWGARMDLTTILDPEGVQRRHFLESIAAGATLRHLGLLPDGAAVADVGAGAGFPGLPVRIVWPIRLTLIETRVKRAAFLREVVAALGLDGVSIAVERAENLGRDPVHREAYDIALARALAPAATLAELASPLVRVGGVVAALKGRRVRQEVEAARRAFTELGVDPSIEGTPGGGQLLLLRKVRPTPRRYPRRPGMPAKRPL